MIRLFTFTIFLSALLLFMVQPMVGKVLLPLMGGTPQVWNTCMLFFQALLLLGYAYAHILSTRVSTRVQWVVHAGVLLLAGAWLIWTPEVGRPDADGTWWVVRTLALLIGPAFFAVSTTGPLLQRWFSSSGHPSARDPYFLYAASNAGSMLGLLAYPLVIEPTLSRAAQRIAWTVGFWILIPLIIMSGRAIRGAKQDAPAHKPHAAREPIPRPPTAARRLWWILLAAVPSSLMLGVTQHISTDIAAVPLLWVVPLALYLLTFIIVFSKSGSARAHLWPRAFPFAMLIALMLFLTHAQNPVLLLILGHLGVFFVAAGMCHAQLAEDRPPPAHLTEYFLMMSFGGVLGGVFNALLAPELFSTIFEYPLMLGVTCLLWPRVRAEWTDPAIRPRRVVRLIIAVALAMALLVALLNLDAAIRAGLVRAWAKSISNPNAERTLMNVLAAGIPTLLIACLLLGRGALRYALCAGTALCASVILGRAGTELFRDRTSFGVHVVTASDQGTWHSLSHGTTLHGVQIRTDREHAPDTPHPDDAFRQRLLFGRGPQGVSPDERARWMHLVPTTYYHPNGPIGDVMNRTLDDSGTPRTIALIGLGTGSLLAYARPRSQFHIYEIDPAVVQIARDPRLFRYITDAMRDPGVTTASPQRPGDGRLDIALAPDKTYDLIVIDAFSSDAIPIHLLTKEAVETYFRVLKPDGLIAFHISSRYFDLRGVVARLGGEFDAPVYVRDDARDMTAQEKREAKRNSVWAVMGRTPSSFGTLARNSNWQLLTPGASDQLWTDDFANPLAVFKGWWATGQ